MRRTTSRSGTCSALFRLLKAVKGISATSARLIQTPDVSSKTAAGYSMVVQTSAAMPAIAALTLGSCRMVIDTSAPAEMAAPTTAAP